MFERFTSGARETVERAVATAQRRHRAGVGSEDLLVALAADPSSVAGTVLEAAGLTASALEASLEPAPGAGGLLSAADAEALRGVGIDLDAVLAKIGVSFGPEALASVADRGTRRGRTGRFTPEAKKVLELSLREAVRLRQREINTGHLLLGLLRDTGSRANDLLRATGGSVDQLRTATEAALRHAA